MAEIHPEVSPEGGAANGKDEERKRRDEDALVRFNIISERIIEKAPLDRVVNDAMEAISELYGITEMIFEVTAEDIRPVFRNVVYGYPRENAIEIANNLQSGHYPKNLAERICSKEYRVSKHGYYMSAEEWFKIADTDPTCEFPAYYKSPELSRIPRKSHDEWHEADAYRFAMRDTTGEMLAWLELDYSVDGRLLSEDKLAGVDLFVELITIALQRVRTELIQKRVDSKHVRRTELLEDVLHVASTLLSEREPTRLYQMITTSAASLFGFANVELIIYDETEGVFRWVSMFGFDDEVVRDCKYRVIPTDVVMEDLAESHMIGKTSYLTFDEQQTPRQFAYFAQRPAMADLSTYGRRKADDFRAEDTLAFALHDSAGRIVGVLYPAVTHDGKLPDKDIIEAIEFFTSLAEVAIENTRLSHEREQALRLTSQRTEQLSKILDMTSGMMYVRDLDQMLESFVRTIAQVSGIRRMTLGLKHDDAGVYRVEATFGYSKKASDQIKRLSYPIAMVDSIHETGLATPTMPPAKWRKKVGRMTYFMPAESVNLYPEDLVYYPEPELIRLPRRAKDSWHELDYMDTFIFDSNGKAVGYLEILKPRDDRMPDPETIEIVEIFASLAGIAIENARNFQEHIDSRKDAELYTDLLSHDIKNYNQAILGYLDFLKTKPGGRENAALIDKITEQVMNASWLASNVRTMSRVTFGDVDLTRVDLGSVLLQCSKAVGQYFPSRKTVFLCDVEEGQCFTRADELIKELFTNILTNAVKYDAHEIVEIELSVEKTFEEHDRKSWLVSVADHGVGIPEDVKTIIFDRFSKAPKKKGSGLGLHIVRTLANRYGGAVWVEDRVKGDPTKGSVFKVRLPAID